MLAIIQKPAREGSMQMYQRILSLKPLINRKSFFLYSIQAGVYTLNGYFAHADQKNLLRFVNGMRKKSFFLEIRKVMSELVQRGNHGIFP